MIAVLYSLAFQPGTTGLAYQVPTVIEDLKLLAISRLYLDNFAHIKAYWVTLGEETASLGLHWGADDVDGTIGEERIMHAAGATSPVGLAKERMQQLIREAGCTPVERDTLYNSVLSTEDEVLTQHTALQLSTDRALAAPAVTSRRPSRAFPAGGRHSDTGRFRLG